MKIASMFELKTMIAVLDARTAGRDLPMDLNEAEWENVRSVAASVAAFAKSARDAARDASPDFDHTKGV